MTRAMNEDGTPWWVSTGPPQPTSEPQAESPKFEIPTDSPEEPASVSSESWQDAMRAGLGLFTAFAQVVTETIDQQAADTPKVHSVSDCGVCPVCVAVSALKEHDPRLGGLVEGALAGVASSAEKLAELIPDAKDVVAQQLIESVVKAFIKR